MSKLPRPRQKPNNTVAEPRTFFLTTTTWQRRQIFKSDRMAELLVKTIYHYRDKTGFLLHEFTIMPEHNHILATVQPGLLVEKLIQLIKGGFSFRAARELGFKGEVWGRGFGDHLIRDHDDFEIHRDYIRKNAPRRMLAKPPEDYRFCSAHRGYELDAYGRGLKPSPITDRARSAGTAKAVPLRGV